MDKKIYFQTLQDFGKYATRRYPKGGPGGDTPVGIGGIPAELNPTSIVLTAGGVYVPVATMQLWEYTVPKERRLRVQTAHVRAIRRTAAGVSNEWAVYIRARRAASNVAEYMEAAMIWQLNNTVGVGYTDTHPGEFELFEGDTLYAGRYDLSTGGTIAKAANVLAVEYDAFFKSNSIRHSAGIFDSGGSQGQGGNSGNARQGYFDSPLVGEYTYTNYPYR